MVLSVKSLFPPDRPQTETQHQILVVEKSQTTPILIEPGDEVTGMAGLPLEYPGEILHVLSSGDHGWLDVWQDGKNEDGKRTRLRRRVFSRNVSNLVEATVFPLEEDMVQA